MFGSGFCHFSFAIKVNNEVASLFRCRFAFLCLYAMYCTTAPAPTSSHLHGVSRLQIAPPSNKMIPCLSKEINSKPCIQASYAVLRHAGFPLSTRIENKYTIYAGNEQFEAGKYNAKPLEVERRTRANLHDSCQGGKSNQSKTARSSIISNCSGSSPSGSDHTSQVSYNFLQNERLEPMQESTGVESPIDHNHDGITAPTNQVIFRPICRYRSKNDRILPSNEREMPSTQRLDEHSKTPLTNKSRSQREEVKDAPGCRIDFEKSKHSMKLRSRWENEKSTAGGQKSHFQETKEHARKISSPYKPNRLHEDIQRSQQNRLTSESSDKNDDCNKQLSSCEGHGLTEATSKMKSIIVKGRKHEHDEKYFNSRNESKKSKNFADLYDVLGVLGQGGGGMVYKAVRRTDNQPVAIKRIMREKVKRWEKVKGRKIPQEIALMLRVNGHHGVVKLLEWFDFQNSFVMILERPKNSVDLFDYIREVGQIEEQKCRMIFKQIVKAIHHIHECGVVHRDVKDENIVLDRDTEEAKLIDFGCGTLLCDEPYKDFSGTPEFYPPEWFNEGYYYARSSATWSLGVLLYDMLCGDIPFRKKREISRGVLKFKVSLSREVKHLISWMLSMDPDSRPNLIDIVRHPWFNDTNK
ncbi:uncharacterized protein LOC143455741 [Clavelina lepadiformis]|uniref:uncharacterized protein LOC143455741 n=1 Tax=Clavelina lepadiformis TaxID=159417 RepID=UPI004041AFA0